MRSGLWRKTRLEAVLMLSVVVTLAGITSVAAGDKVRLAQNQSPISGVSIIADRKSFFAENGLDPLIERIEKEKAKVEKGQVAEYRVTMNLTFVLDD